MAIRQPDTKRWLVLLAVMLAFLPVVLDMTILHVAVPTLTQALGASSTQVLWIIDIYPLLMAGLLVPMGTLADRIGNRQVMNRDDAINGFNVILLQRSGDGIADGYHFAHCSPFLSRTSG